MIDHLRGLQDHNSVSLQLNDLHSLCGCHTGLDPVSLPTLMSDDELEKIINELLRYIFKNKSYHDAPAAMKEYFMDQLMQALTAGYGNSLDDLDFDTPDYKMLDALQNDVVKFSAAKSDVMNQAITRELIGADGKLRDFREFKTAAYNIINDHKDAWLKSEYNLAVTSAQAASKWVRIEEDADTLPILEFDAVMDGHTTEICRNFNGIRLPYTDPFWDMYYIPNHYGERSTIRQDIDDGAITDTSTIIYPDKIPDIFKVNLAKNRMVFPPGHPYFNGK